MYHLLLMLGVIIRKKTNLTFHEKVNFISYILLEKVLNVCEINLK